MTETELINKYICQHIEPEGNYLYRLYRATNIHTIHGRMASGHIQGRLLKMLVEMIRPKNILEVGTFSGYSAICLAQGLQEAFSSYKDNFPGWSLQTSAMHQLAVWTMLEDVGFGASLQHYNPLIDEEVRHTWHLPEEWHLIAEMPFGLPVQGPGDKDFKDLDTRVKVFK